VTAPGGAHHQSQGHFNGATTAAEGAAQTGDDRDGRDGSGASGAGGAGSSGVVDGADAVTDDLNAGRRRVSLRFGSPASGTTMGRRSSVRTPLQEQQAANETLDVHMDALVTYGAEWRRQASSTMAQWRHDQGMPGVEIQLCLVLTCVCVPVCLCVCRGCSTIDLLWRITNTPRLVERGGVAPSKRDHVRGAVQPNRRARVPRHWHRHTLRHTA